MLEISLLKVYLIASEFLDLLNKIRIKIFMFMVIIYQISVLLLRMMNRLFSG